MDETNDNQNINKDVSVSVEKKNDSLDQANMMLDLENLINSTLAKIDTLTKETSKLNEMLNSVLENDETYLSHLEAAKEANRVKNATKNEILKRPEVSHTVDKLREIKTDLKDDRDALSGYLYEYSRLSGSDEFEANDGTVKRIIYTAKLVKG